MDQYTIEKEKITSLTLMQRAGNALFNAFIQSMNPNKATEKIVVLCGPGNNGGDALVIADLLAKQQYTVTVLMLFSEDKLSEETQSMFDAIKTRVRVIPLNNDFNKAIKTLIDESHFIIDGMFGIGHLRLIQGTLKEVIAYVNATRAKVVSIDIPSGLDATTGLVRGTAIKADLTLVVQALKLGNLLHQGLDYSRQNLIVDAGIDTSLNTTQYEQLLSDTYKNTLPKRAHFSHKYQYGNILVIGGHVTMPGAPQLAALAALRSGCGLVSLGVRAQERNYFMSTPYEVLVHTYETDVKHLLAKKTAYIFGPGLGNDTSNTNILNGLLNDDIPIVIDGDGIKALKDVTTYNAGKTIVMTPHIGELAAFLGKDTKAILENTVEVLRTLTKKHPFWVVLKGPCTLIAHQGTITFIQAGNPGLAKAGSGDVLSGVIGAFLSRDISVLKALSLAVLIHGSAADLAQVADGEDGYLATDVIEYIPQALAFYKSSKYT